MRDLLERQKDRPVSEVTLGHDRVELWAVSPEIGNLSFESAHAFAAWVEKTHHDGEYDPTLTVGEFLRLCLERWIGGRAI